MTEIPERPSGIRWWILAVTTLSSLLLYLDRICVSFAAESIRADFGATEIGMGWFLSAFFWSYALCQVPAGWLSDRFGIRTVLTAYILLWSAFTGWMGLVGSFAALLVCRFGCGVTQAGAYPSAARAVREWMPLTQRGMASSVVAFGGRIGGAVAPLLTGALMLAVATWNRSPEFQPSEILQVEKLAHSLHAADDAQPPAWLRAVQTRLTSPQRDLVARIASAEGSAETGDAAQGLAEILNSVNLLTVLSESSSASTELPASVETIFKKAQDAVAADPNSSPLHSRRLWEAALPKVFKKLEARGWRPVMVAYGLVGILVAAAFWWVFRNRPAEHGGCNAAEQRLISAGPATVASTAAAPVAQPFPWVAFQRDVSLWGNCVMQFGTNIGWVFLVTSLPQYLEQVHRAPVLQRGWMSFTPLAAGMVGMLLGGPWTDVATNRHGLRWGRRLPVLLSRILAMGGYVLCIAATLEFFGPLGGLIPAWTAVAGLSLVAVATDLGVAAVWAFAQDVGGKHTAAILGWANMWGNLGAAVAPLLFALVLGKSPGVGDWNNLFVLCMGGFLFAAFGAAVMDASRPLAGSAPAES